MHQFGAESLPQLDENQQDFLVGGEHQCGKLLNVRGDGLLCRMYVPSGDWQSFPHRRCRDDDEAN